MGHKKLWSVIEKTYSSVHLCTSGGHGQSPWISHSYRPVTYQGRVLLFHVRASRFLISLWQQTITNTKKSLHTSLGTSRCACIWQRAPGYLGADRGMSRCVTEPAWEDRVKESITRSIRVTGPANNKATWNPALVHKKMHSQYNLIFFYHLGHWHDKRGLN